MNTITRPDFIQLIEAAHKSGSLRFSRQACLAWLAYYPGDLPVRLLYARTLIQAGQAERAVPVLTALCQADPQHIESWEQLQTALKQNLPDYAGNNSALSRECQAALQALGVEVERDLPLPEWAEQIHQVQTALQRSDVDAAEELIHLSLLNEPTPVLVAVTHLQVAQRRGLPPQALYHLADHYHTRFPEALVPLYLQAESLIEGGESDRAVALLHQAASQDVTGQVAARLWSEGHAYRDLWPTEMEIPFEIAIPSEVAGLMGLNRLIDSTPEPVIEGDTVPIRVEQLQTQDSVDAGAVLGAVAVGAAVNAAASPGSNTGAVKYAHFLPESLRSVQVELERVASSLRRSQLARADGRFPIYVILTTRQGLEQQYGKRPTESVIQELKRLAATVSSRPDWESTLLVVDDEKSMQPLGLSPANPVDPWSIKRILTDFDEVLSHQGEMIGAVLIVGGPNVVPFHLLPNPVDDVDVEVPSDNPYATRDENYFIPEWPVGRLPGGTSRNPQSLVKAIRQIGEQQSSMAHPRPWYRRWWNSLQDFIQRQRKQVNASWGYTAAIWRRASLSVFRPIGEPQALYVSPPVQATTDQASSEETNTFPVARMGYFNLHGLPDSSDWYGQRDPSEPADTQANLPDYPVALRPADVVNSGKAPQIVFSEACYGAHIIAKDFEEAISLKFLVSGSRAVVGSTCTSYGSVSTPLIAADLLGHAFWKYLQDGLPAGEALRRAKIHLAKEMHRRQGYLDGEDQKTLISFILYGDPLAYLSTSVTHAKGVLRPVRSSATVKTVCDRAGNCSDGDQNWADSLQEIPTIPAETVAEVKRVVAEYLPGMQDARARYNQTHPVCTGQDHTCPTASLGAKSQPDQPITWRVVTLSKSVQYGNGNGSYSHPQYARLTLDDSGKVVKLAVTR